MDLRNAATLRYRLQTMPGGKWYTDWLFIAAFILYAGAGVALMTVYGDISGGLFMLAFGVFLTMVFLKDMPREKKESEESWKRLTEEETRLLNDECMTAPVLGNALITRYAIVLNKSQGPVAIPAREILWIYPKAVRHYFKGVIPTGKTYTIHVVTCDGKTHKFDAPNARRNRKAEFPEKEDMQTVVSTLDAVRGGIIVGYDERIDRIAKTDFGKLKALVQRRSRK